MTVDRVILGAITEFCYFHHQPGHSDLERKLFNEKFIRTNKKRLRDLKIAAAGMKLTPLVELTCVALTRLIETSTTEEIRQAFDLPDDLTEEDQWQPITIATDDPQVRLLNKLGERKRRELEQKKKFKNVEVEAPHEDNRSIDELMLFINGEHEGPKKTNTCKSKKKNPKGKDKKKTKASVSDKWITLLRGSIYIDLGR
ncbi:hypothetical protein QVD17_27827 [Tagetes erecta]|uniref:SKP1 component dimerisation domain-containing protein n=1 Tax=Tagetes erecta TaxID=13708 RepID=A0AAD8NS46_TARER|nr:hypothetical protein QVD17_27827 [Tagetes erecta]